jgi:hypothetical protein
MIIDTHVRWTGHESQLDVLHALDAAGIDFAVLVPAPPMRASKDETAHALRQLHARLGALIKGQEDRLMGMAAIDPRHEGALDELARSIESNGLRGVAMWPQGWRPDEGALQQVFGRIGDWRLPLLMHSGVCMGETAQLCERPLHCEALRTHPRLKVSIPHLAWPWVDEALAVAQLDRLRGVPPSNATFRLGLGAGLPAACCTETVTKALAILGSEFLQFGSGHSTAGKGRLLLERKRKIADVMDQLELDAHVRQHIWRDSAASWLGMSAVRSLAEDEPVHARDVMGRHAAMGTHPRPAYQGLDQHRPS